MDDEKADMGKINILGVKLTDCSLRESLSRMDGYVKSGALNTVLYVTAPMLILAGRDGQEKQRIESMDLTLCGDADILRVAGIESRSRIYEVENHIFLKEFLRRLSRGRSTVYLLADSEENEKRLRRELSELQRELLIVGSRIAGENEDAEETANSINDVAPAAVISRTAPGRQEEWMTRLRPFLNAEIWLGIPEDMKLGGYRESFRRRLLSVVYRKIFHTRINRYNGSGDDDGQADLKK